MIIKLLENDKDKCDLISRLSSENKELLFFGIEEPEESFSVESLGSSITKISPPYDYAMLQPWLYYGNWWAIYPGNPDFRPFNTFKTSQMGIERLMAEANIQLLIDSFHDNLEWNVIELGQ